MEGPRELIEQSTFSQNSDYPAQQSNKLVSTGKWFSMLVIIAGFVGVSIVYADSYFRLEENYQECQKIIDEAESKGLQSKFASCTQPSISSPLIGYNQEKNDLETITKKIDDELLSLKLNIEETNTETELINLQLEGLEIEYPNSESSNEEDLYLLLDKKTKHLQELKETLGENEAKTDKLSDHFGRAILYYQYPELNKYSDFLQEYENLKQTEQNINYKNLKSRYLEMQDVVVNQLEAESAIDPSLEKEELKEILFSYEFYSSEDFIEINNQANSKVRTEEDAITIIGDPLADKAIIEKAEARGYVLRKEADPATLVTIDNEKLLPNPAAAWQKMKSVALLDSIQLKLNSGFRSTDRQKEIFLERFNSSAVWNYGIEPSADNILAGYADGALEETLTFTAPPGYSKHHSGITVDINDSEVDSSIVAFADTDAYEWLSANNYLNAKRFGFIPSYPDGVENVGPNPEPWEYIWVGEDSLKLDFQI